MNAPVTRLITMVNNGTIIAVKDGGVKKIPARYLADNGEMNKFIVGLTALLKDGGWEETEILDYMFTNDPSLPGRPIDCLHGHLAREVMRRAQAMGF
nr:Rv2175c family DNA-binding protein [Corynebacterium choanae]